VIRIPHNSKPLERQIVKLLLDLKEIADREEYPPELYIPRRDAYRAQVDTVKEKSGQAGTHPDGS
jgi:hypothetical protein